MKFHNNKFLTTVAAVALALAVGACSSSSDDDETAAITPTPPATTEPTPEPTPELTPAEQLMAAQEAVTAADAMVAALSNSSTADEAAAAYAALGAAQTALHAANSLSENQIAAKQEEINDLQAEINRLTLALAEATKEPEGPTAEEIADAAAATKAAGTKEKAIAAEADQTAVAGLGGTDDTTLTMDISRDRMGTTVEFTDTDLMGDDDPKFAQAMDLGNGRTMHTRTMEADSDGNVVEEVVIVSTDIAAPKATPFAMVADQMLNARDLDADVDADGDGTDTNDFTALTVIAGTDDVNLPKIISAKFTATTTALLTFASNDTTTDDKDEAFETVGTYNGAMGKYRCNGDADCTVNINAMGKISEIGNGWVFTPDKGVTSDVPDADF